MSIQIKHMLVLGKRKSSLDPTRTGGAIIAFEQLLVELQYYQISYEVIDLNYRNYGGKWKAIFKIYVEILKKGWGHEVLFLNGSNNALLLFGLPLFSLCLGKRKKIILRFFGGHFYDYWQKQIWLARRLLHSFLKRASLVFFEQQYQVDKFRSMGYNVHWFPNVRRFDNREKLYRQKEKEFKGRYVFISHVRKEKGVDELLYVKHIMDNFFDLQIFGPIVQYKPPRSYKGVFETVYKRPLNPSEVIGELLRHDVLILPSYKEGYPGIIIEALAVGMPVIISDLPSIREMLTGNEGIFIRPGDPESLKEAVLAINQESFANFSKAAFASFARFDASRQMPKILDLISKV